jgi:hypothetical protein
MFSDRKADRPKGILRKLVARKRWLLLALPAITVARAGLKRKSPAHGALQPPSAEHPGEIARIREAAASAQDRPLP